MPSEGVGSLCPMPTPLTPAERSALTAPREHLVDLRCATVVALLLEGWGPDRVRAATGTDLLRNAPAGAMPLVEALIDRLPAAFPLSPDGAAPMSQLSLTRMIRRYGARCGIPDLGLPRLEVTRLSLRVQEGESVADLARELGVTERAVRRRLQRAGALGTSRDETVVWEIPTAG